MEKVILILVPMLLTIPVAMLLSSARTSRKLRISYGTVILSAFVVTFFWLGFVMDWEIYTFDFWSHHRPKAIPRDLMLKLVALTFIMCALVALGVVHYYQRRSKRDETPVA